MQDKNIISISEAAKLKGVTAQSIYQRIKKDLQPFTIVIDNKKYLKIEALDFIKSASKIDKADFKVDLNFKETLIKLESLKAENAQLLSQIEQLKQDLNFKETLINTLQTTLNNKDIFIQGLTAKLSQLTEHILLDKPPKENFIKRLFKKNKSL